MLATLLSVVQIFGSLNCLLMWSVCLDLTASSLLPLPFPFSCSALRGSCCGAVWRHVSVRCGTVRYESVLFQTVCAACPVACGNLFMWACVCVCLCLPKLGFICQLPFSLCLQTNLPLVIASVRECVCVSISSCVSDATLLKPYPTCSAPSSSCICRPFVCHALAINYAHTYRQEWEWEEWERRQQSCHL